MRSDPSPSSVPNASQRSTILDRPLAQARKFDGWKILAVLCLLFMNFGLMLYGGSVLNAHMARGMNMPRANFGAGVSLAYLLMGLGAPLAVFSIRKLGYRLTLCAGMLLLAAATLCLGTLVQGAMGFTLAYGLLGGLGLSLGGLLPLQSVVSNWFLQRRSLATAILLSSGGVGGLLASYLFNFLLGTAGLSWQQVWLLMAGLSLLLALLTFFMVRENPGEVGQFPDGINQDAPVGGQDPGTQKTGKVYQTRVEWSFQEAIRTPTVWLILVGSLGMALSFEFCSAYGVIHLMDIGFPDAAASYSVGILAFFAVLGRLLMGYLGDRVELHWLMAGGSLLIGIGCLLVIAPVSAAMITLYAILTGLGQGLVFVAMFTMIPNYFGAKATPGIMAVGMPFSAGAAAGMIFLGGVIRTQSGSYVIGLMVCAAFALLAAASSSLAKPPRK